MYWLLGCSDREGDKTDRRSSIIEEMGWLRWEPNLGLIIRLEDDYFVTLDKLEQLIPEIQ